MQDVGKIEAGPSLGNVLGPRLRAAGGSLKIAP
jgi:hypothetical protein